MPLATWLRSRGFNATATGAVLPTSSHDLVACSLRVAEALRIARIDIVPGMVVATYDPANGSALVAVSGVDELLR